MQQKRRKWLASLAVPLALALTLGLGGCSSGSDPAPAPDPTPSPAPAPEPEPTPDPLAAKYIGSASCKMCHTTIHDQWKSSWHTKKTTWGPAATQAAVATAYKGSKSFSQHQAEAQTKFLPGVKEMWDAGEIHSHMVLDRATLTDADRAAGYTDKNYVTKKKYHYSEVEVIIGETRKQRYAVYYDGKPVEEALYSYSTNGGIGWTVDTSVTVSYPGNLQRAGYKFLTVEMDALKNPVVQKSNMYGTWRSWQEQCIGCHTTGFDPEAWKAAKADYVASGGEGDLRGVYITEIEISCEACHGPGREHMEYKVLRTGADTIINPKNLAWNDPTRKMICEQCHTRAQTNLAYGDGSNDNRGFVLGEHDYMDIMQYTRPDWTNGNRQVSIDGKGRRDHQQDMDIRLTTYAGGPAWHGVQACFDCHDAHNVGNAAVLDGIVYSTAAPDKTLFTTTTGANPDPTGQIRLKASREQLCGGCHGAQWEDYLAKFNGATGWPATGYGNWGNERGRGDRKQHIFNTDDDGRSYGLAPSQYTWGQLLTTGQWVAIWPWEVSLPIYQATHTGEFPPN